MKKNLNKILILFFATLTIGFSQNNYSLSFDGVDDYVNISSGDDFNVSDDQELTISAYIKTNENGYLFNAEFSFGYYFYISQSSELALWYNGTGNGCGANTDIRDGDWHHVVASYDGNSIKIYIDGQLDNNCENMGSLESRDGSIDITIGNRPGSTHFNGGIDEVSIWNKALTQEEVENTIQVELNGDEEGLIGYWNFNDGEGTTLTDLSGNGNNGTISGATWSNDVPILPTPPVIGGNNSFSFDGDDDRVELPNQITEGLTSVTFMAWFNTTDHSGYSNIVQDDGPSGALYIRYNPDGSFKYVFKASQGWRSISISPPSYGVWHHVAMSWDGNNIKAYLDGEEVGSSSGSGTMSGGGPIYIGNWQQQEGFSGKIDDVQYWNIALSESEIQTHMNTEPTGNEEGLIGYWNFNESEGSELIDLSGNGYNGTVYGATWSGDGAPVEAPVLGCTDLYAENYDSEANSDDGSCSGLP